MGGRGVDGIIGDTEFPDEVFLPAFHLCVMFKIEIPTWNKFERVRVTHRLGIPGEKLPQPRWRKV